MKIKSFTNMLMVLILLIPLAQTTALGVELAAPEAVTYFVSQSLGNDANNGLSQASPFKTISKVNSLDLKPGDQVLFKCGDIWRATPLVITKSGTVDERITFGSYPANCPDKPVLSGAQPISGWQSHSVENIYVADLKAGENHGKFAYGVNQLFKGAERLPMGRWPNLDELDHGYAEIDSQPAPDQIGDNGLLEKDWSGAVAHIRGMRWYILNRKVNSRSGTILNLDEDVECWDNDCTDWGYFLNNHIKTLDQDGEWFYDTDTNKLYLYTTGGIPADGLVEGSVILRNDDRASAGLILGTDLGNRIAYVTIENLAVERWFRHGISTPANLNKAENHHLVLQDNRIADIDSIGINFASWVYGTEENQVDGWRGGYQITVSGNTIERANRMGINTYTRDSTFTGNTIRDIGRIENLGAAGMGCALNATGGACTEDGDGIRVKIDRPDDSGNKNNFVGNRLERIAYNGIDVFGFRNTFEHNVIIQACISKADCGAVRAYGSGKLDNTSVYQLTFTENIIIDTIGNTDGCHPGPDYDPLFGFGLYFDHYSRDITVQGNTIISSTVHGILFQDATGTLVGNTLYNNGRTYPNAGAQVRIEGSPAYVGTHTGNILYSLNVDARTLSASGLSQLGKSDDNYFFSPYRNEQIRVNGDKTLAGWQDYSDKDAGSQAHWFTLGMGDPPRSRIFYNDSSESKNIPLGNILYADLDQNPVSGKLTLAPYQSQILIETGKAADLVLSMIPLSPVDTVPGAPISYTITISNQGLIAAQDVRLVNPLPAEIENTSWQVSPSSVSLEPETRYTWEIGQLAVGQSYTFNVAGQFISGLVPDTPLLLHASASTTSPEQNLENNQAVIYLGEWQYLYLPVMAR